jgi:hypothetical protein
VASANVTLRVEQCASRDANVCQQHPNVHTKFGSYSSGQWAVGSSPTVNGTGVARTRDGPQSSPYHRGSLPKIWAWGSSEDLKSPIAALLPRCTIHQQPTTVLHLHPNLPTSLWIRTPTALISIAGAMLTAFSLSPTEQRELQNRMEKKQMKEFMNVRNPRATAAFFGPDSKR